ncbi:FadR family transcriptional regulator [Tessaracoccus rhinocerotis]|uniref:FadR family transcriptional regulator n=1 Tax=Tessaracoccus rhinocerotis TaxID=1689449 RepID=A0A553JY95_9ACTN|nr:GntR family transcriptional regulator [Tessaracoccus rhinocerotis]TRY17413.1 FadR family transcriptional regulator [Tessaracoccus rhinocerotis]
MAANGQRAVVRNGSSLASTAAKQIKALILSNGLHPGDALPSESELCERLNVSRSSVREAIRTLTTLEIVDVQHGRGTFVGAMTLQPLVETLAFRSVISPGDDFRALREVVDVRVGMDQAFANRVVAHFAGRRDDRLHELVDEMARRAAVEEDFEAADREFHTRLLRETGLEMAAQLVAAFWDVHTAVKPQLEIPTPEDINVTAEAHGDILRAAEAGDAEAYRAAVTKHYEPILRGLSKAAR